MEIRVQAEPFDYGAECGAFAAGRVRAGAVVSFAGIVRDDGGLERLVLEHYPGMTERALQDIAQQATTRWALEDCLIIHRHGEMRVGETIMMVATAALHRADAFAAAEFLMDYLKSRAPFWKKEFGRDGAEWVAAKEADEDALTRWQG